VATSTGGTAVLARSTADAAGNSAPALVATAGGSGLAASFTGDVSVSGTLTATTKHFVIDHPLDPASKYLVHASVESGEQANVYSGNIILDERGEAVVNLPAWVQALCEDFRYQLTCVGCSAPVYVADEVADNQFRIAGGPAGMKVSWQLTGIRKDEWAKAHPLIVEQDKPGKTNGSRQHLNGPTTTISR
jgi:trimeric autotransporter adhesin